MSWSRAAAAAIGICLIASSPALAADSGRARANDQGSISDLCHQFRQEYHQLSDKQKHGRLTRDDRNRMNDLTGKIKSLCD